ncbi:alpha-1 2-mannosidase [Bacteroidia bacterium]|nr:alpha-1 2-mannosidase [Bacteroidia bacterium]
MKKNSLFLWLVTCMMMPVFAGQKEPVDYVDTRIGTFSKPELSHGNVYPAIALPWGMNFWTPQTGDMGNGWTYTYESNKIKGFKQTHQPSPWINDYGQFSVMPVTGKPVFDQNERSSWFSHKVEIARPHYYKTYLADHDIVTEITPTERAAIFRFTFPETDSYVVIDAFDNGSYVKIIPEERKIVGYTTKNSGGVPDNFKNYFVIVFDKLFTYTATVSNGEIKTGIPEAKENHAGAIIGFPTRRGEIIHAKIASSFISLEQAELNLKQEIGNKDFETVKAEGRKKWNEILSRVEIEDDNIDNQKIFYSCLYRSTLFPRSFFEYDISGKVIHYSPYNGKILPGYLFTDTGFWDTFRSLFPLLNFLYPAVNEKIQEGLLNAYLESGFFPEWASPGHRDCMIGNNSASIIADAFINGITPKSEALKMYEGLLHGANHVHPEISSTGRLGYEYYNKLGYVPCDIGIKESAARTLEYAYDDWCIYQMGKKLNRPAKEIELYRQRSLNYKNLFDPETRLMRGKNQDGSFQTPFNPFKWGDAFTEGNSWHYTWSVFHDIQGFINLMGGKEPFIAMLDSVFVMPPVFVESYYGTIIHEIREMQIMNMGQYAHGNQPIQHMIYLYNYAGEPWKAQYWVRESMNKLYSATPDGYCGDEDNGQTSAWYVFSALGFYPVCPASGEYVIGSPLFKKATIHFENGKTLEINAPNNNEETRFVKNITFNGKNYTKNYWEYSSLIQGGEIKIEMGNSPDRIRGVNENDFPYSLSL